MNDKQLNSLNPSNKEVNTICGHSSVLGLVNKFIVKFLYAGFLAKVSLVKVRHNDGCALIEGGKKLYEFSPLL